MGRFRVRVKGSRLLRLQVPTAAGRRYFTVLQQQRGEGCGGEKEENLRPKARGAPEDFGACTGERTHTAFSM